LWKVSKYIKKFNLKKLPIDGGIANNLSLNQCDHEFIIDLWELDYGGD
jgi:hypothetical protein